MNKKIQYGIVFALIVLLLVITLPVIVDTDQTESLDDTNESSQLGGTASVYAQLTDAVNNIIWKSADDRRNLPESVVDPVSGKEVVNFLMGIRYQATGTNIDWSSMKVISRWEVFKYRSTNVEKLLSNEWDTKTLTGVQNGDMESTQISIDPLVPDEVTMIYWNWNDELQRKEYITETFEQRTQDSHPFELVFYGHYYVEVIDNEGYKYDQYYKQTVTITLQWVGSDFDIQWSDQEDEDAVSIGIAPAINHLADVVAFRGVTKSFRWVTDDANNDIQKYTVSIDGVVKTQNTFSPSGGIIDWSFKFTELGERLVRVAVEDLQGNIATDEISVLVVSGADNLEAQANGSPEPETVVVEPIDPITRTDAIQGFSRSIDAGVPALSLFGAGIGNTQILVLLAVAGGVGWLLYNRRKR